MTGGTVRRDDHAAVATLTIVNVERRNALSPGVWSGLRAELRDVMADPAIRAVVLTGEGGHFCAGGDISAMTHTGAHESRERLRGGHEITRLIVEGEKPVLAAVEGFAVGAGLSIAAACDIVVASSAAKFACSFNRIGLVPDFGAGWVLPQRVGAGRARWIMLTGDTFGAEQARDWGLVETLTEPGDALRTATELATRMAAEAAPLSNAFAKALLARGATGLDGFLKAEADAQGILFTTQDFAEGRRAFLAKEKPRFEGH